MMKKERNLRLLVSGLLLLAVAAAGIGMYRSDNRNNLQEQEELAQEEKSEDEPSEYEDSVRSEDVNTSNAQARMEEETKETPSSETKKEEEQMEEAATENVQEVLPSCLLSHAGGI